MQIAGITLRLGRIHAPVTVLCMLVLLRTAHAQTPSAAIVGRVLDAQSGVVVQGASVSLRSEAGDSLVAVVVVDSLGAFSFDVRRAGTYTLEAKRLGYTSQRRTVLVSRDTTSLTIALVAVARTLPPVVVEESERAFALHQLERNFRAMDHVRVFSAADFIRSGQLLAGTFLLGRGGINTVACQRSQGFLPPGKVRTVPVDHEPADIWWPCVMARNAAVPVRISIDGGAAEPFASISQHELKSFAMIAVIHGGAFVYAYTNGYVDSRARTRRE